MCVRVIKSKRNLLFTYAATGHIYRSQAHSSNVFVWNVVINKKNSAKEYSLSPSLVDLSIYILSTQGWLKRSKHFQHTRTQKHSIYPLENVYMHFPRPFFSLFPLLFVLRVGVFFFYNVCFLAHMMLIDFPFSFLFFQFYLHITSHYIAWTISTCVANDR